MLCTFQDGEISTQPLHFSTPRRRKAALNYPKCSENKRNISEWKLAASRALPSYSTTPKSL